MLFLATRSHRSERGVILAARNSHKSFIHAAALLDLDVRWMYPSEFQHISEARITKDDVEAALSASADVDAVYITTPDYLGNIADVKGISEVCKKYNVLLLVDNAHGAYLKFLSPSRHPIDLGADMCADSAHKTLPVLTGGAYLHISKAAERFVGEAKWALSLFASTSPSYLILSSLDLCNAYLQDSFERKLSDALLRVSSLKAKISDHGIGVLDSEPMKIVLAPLDFGYTGLYLAEILRSNSIECEFADEDFCVLMPSPENPSSDYDRIAEVIVSLPRKDPIDKHKQMFTFSKPEQAVSIREAIFSENETVSVCASLGRVAAVPAVSCPPAVPIVVSGEYITDEAILLFKRYGIEKINVVKTKE